MLEIRIPDWLEFPSKEQALKYGEQAEVSVLFSEKYILTEDDYQEFSGNLMEAFQELEKEYGPPPREKEQGYLFQALWYQAEELNPGEGDCFGD